MARIPGGVLAAALLLAGCAGAQQSASCERFVRCSGALDAAAGITTDVRRFEAGGDCWGSEPGAKLCDEACTNGLAWIAAHEPSAPQECLP